MLGMPDEGGAFAQHTALAEHDWATPSSFDKVQYTSLGADANKLTKKSAYTYRVCGILDGSNATIRRSVEPLCGVKKGERPHRAGTLSNGTAKP